MTILLFIYVSENISGIIFDRPFQDEIRNVWFEIYNVSRWINMYQKGESVSREYKTY